MDPTSNTSSSTAQASLDSFIQKVETAIINPLITLLTLAAFILFAWGVVEFIMGAGEQEKRSTGKKHMLWGLVGLAIMFGAQAVRTIIAHIVGAK